MSQTQKSPAPIAAGCEAQYPNKQPDYITIARQIKANRRYMRATTAMLSGHVDRPDLDKIVGTTNAPEYVRLMRKMGLTIDMERIKCNDRDAMRMWYGRYHLSQADRDGLRHAVVMQGVK
ncbi:hypothetical protein [uncultured Alcanivorax sp.]|uniref:hypothetical protein n=1 Tax=uncultured Alcanivorax sp. TaxID=191215 RepID=UPI00260CC5BA|nr:hypothetical protein [uncultured Alcanivorax sp.]